MAEQEPTREELEQMLEQIRQLSIQDILLSTLSTLAQLGYGKLQAGSRDLDQVRLSIDAMRALVPVLEGAVEEEVTRDFGQLVANLQLAYASAVAEGSQDE